MRLNIDKLMIGFVVIMAVSLYAPAIIKDCEAKQATDENTVEEVFAEVQNTEHVQTVVLEDQTIQSLTEQAEPDFLDTVNEDITLSTYQMRMDLSEVVEDACLNEKGKLNALIQEKKDSKFTYPEFIAEVKKLPVEKEPSLIPEGERVKAEEIYADYDAFQETVEEYYAEKEAQRAAVQAAQAAQTQSVQQQSATYTNVTGDGVLTASKGVNYGPSGKETYYNLNMDGVVNVMQSMGYNEQYWVREDGVKMYGDYVMVAADLNTHPRGSLVESSLGTAIVVDTGGFAASDPNQLDIATSW